MTAFSLPTSYATDWELADNTEYADWEPDNQGLEETHKLWRVPIKEIVVRRGNITHQDFASLAATVGVSPATAAFLVANPTDQDFDLRVNDIFSMDDGTRMMVTGLERPELGPFYRMLVEPVKTNADAN